MEVVYPNGIVVSIDGNVARITYGDSLEGFIHLDKLPKGIKVGDRVFVTLEVTLKSVKLPE